ncbi:MAG TPA: hypothetical protein V6C58_26335 [Allocoleopsis sp.]
MEDLKKHILESIDTKILRLQPKTAHRVICEKLKENIDNVDLNNSYWKIILNRSQKNELRDIVLGSPIDAVEKLEQRHYSKNSNLPSYELYLKIRDVNIPIGPEIIKNYVRDKENYAKKYIEQ